MTNCYCGVPEHLDSRMARRDPHVRWYLGGQLPGVPVESLRMWVAEAFARWSAICGVSAEEVGNGQSADLYIDCARIDGPQGVLAWCELPGPAQQRLRLDNTESWVEEGAHFTRNGIILVNVLCHELGHLVGIGHLSSGNLMAPTYDPAIGFPQDGDIAEAVARYGANKPRTRPPPDDPPPAGKAEFMVLMDAAGRVLKKFRLSEEALALEFREVKRNAI